MESGRTGGLSGESNPQPVRPAVCPCPTHLSGLIKKKKGRSGVASSSFSLSPICFFFFIADDVSVCQEPGRPNPLPVYYASETAEAIHTRSPLDEDKKSSVTCAYLETCLQTRD